jgi:hypothetical protein
MMYTFIYCMFYDIWCLSNLILVAINSLLHRFMSKISKSSYLHATLFININICITFFYCCIENGKSWFEKPNKSHNVGKRLRITLQVTKNIDFFHCELKGVCKKIVSIASCHFFQSAHVLTAIQILTLQAVILILTS